MLNGYLVIGKRVLIVVFKIYKYFHSFNCYVYFKYLITFTSIYNVNNSDIESKVLVKLWRLLYVLF